MRNSGNKVKGGKEGCSKPFTREDFTSVLHRCHNIIRNNDKLSPEAAFDEISKILFMKIRYERENNGSEIFTLEKYKQEEADYDKVARPVLRIKDKDSSYMQIMFEKTKSKFKDDQLFEEDDSIKIRQNSFEQILKELQVFNLSNIQDDVKGIAFERFLGKTFRGELGQFFTPRTIVDFMTHVLDPREGEIVCDPACGSGGFLIKAFEYIREQIEKDIDKAKENLCKELRGKSYARLTTREKKAIDKRVEKVCVDLESELDPQRSGSRMYNLSRDSIYGTDANPRMARTSKMNMIMHGDGHGGVHHHDGLLNVNGIYEERFDVILTNPPFGARIDKRQTITESDRFTNESLIAHYKEKYGDAYDAALKQVDGNIGKPLLSLYDTGKMSGLTEVLFMERCLRLLKKGGRMGMVLPEGVLNTSSLQKVREYFEGRAKIILICSIPQDVFIAAGATVKPSLVFFKRFTEAEEIQYKDCRQRAESKCFEKYRDEYDKLNAELQSLVDIGKGRTKAATAIRGRVKNILCMVKEESKPLVKEYFDYEIPVAKVDDAGITSTGSISSGNQLPAIGKEYTSYRCKKKLWAESQRFVSYKIQGSGEIVRIEGNKETVLNGDK